MAISRVTYEITRALRAAGRLPQDAAILELGEANWYGDLPAEVMHADIAALARTPDEGATLAARLAQTLEGAAPTRAWDLAKLFYRLFYGRCEVVAVDLHGTPEALARDLNRPFDLGRRFDVTINNGTAEHVFNAGEVFATMHRHTRPGGLMLHEGPLVRGWVDHGFFTFQPSLFFDLADANGYGITFFAASYSPFTLRELADRDAAHAFANSRELPAEPAFFVVLEKGAAESPFIVPMQRPYARGAG